MAKTIYKQKGSFKGLLFVFGIIIIGIILFYTQQLVNQLQLKSKEYLNFRIRVLQENINNPNLDTELGFLLTEVIQGADYPVIFTDTDMQPQMWININPEIDSAKTITPELEIILSELLLDMDAENEPFAIEYEGIKLGYYHYGVSPVISRLRWLPYIEISVAILFIFIGYVGFSQIKKSEQRYIWVGMAKETAHQLGTPISSILGWIELLKDNTKGLNQALEEIETDAKRLSKVASRFSQIGSNPSLKKYDVVEILTNAILYFRKRLPQLQKKLIIEEQYLTKPVINLNNELFEWVIENLVKNAMDAIESRDGKIIIKVSESQQKKYVNIDIKDNGRGINLRDRKNIFKPGFSTKVRGWGLGLSLAKRIVEDYHGGKLFIKETRPGEGTTFRIILEKQIAD